MKNLEEFRKVKLKKDLYHQGIGGKVFQIEKEGTVSYMLDVNLDDITIALHNFMERRIDLITNNNENIKIYYGHVLETGLGYFICDDEIESFED